MANKPVVPAVDVASVVAAVLAAMQQAAPVAPAAPAVPAKAAKAAPAIATQAEQIADATRRIRAATFKGVVIGTGKASMGKHYATFSVEGETREMWIRLSK